MLVPLVGAVVAFALFGRFRPVGCPAALPDARRVVVVIPARNEEHSLPLLLDDLARSHLDSHVVVVDDGSTDRTREVASGRAGVTVVAAPELPPGWCGKNWACDVGVRAASPDDGDVLVFLDADVRLAPDALAMIVAERDAANGVLSVQPHHVVPTLVEQLSALFNVVSVMGIAAGTDRPKGMFGPVLCFVVEDYRRAGGHAGVRDQLVEDLALARRVVGAGIPLAVRSGGDHVRFRMYPLGLRQLWEGWTKNISSGATGVPAWRSIGVGLWLVSIGSAWMQLIGGGWSAAVGALVAAGSTAVLLRRVGTYRWWAVAALPVLWSFFVLVFAWSALRTFGGRRVTWKGRTIGV